SADLPDRAGAATLVLGSDRLCGVLNYGDPTRPCHFTNGVEIGTTTEQVYGNDAANLWVSRKNLGQEAGIEVEGGFIDVAKDRRSSGMGDRSGGRKERVG